MSSSMQEDCEVLEKIGHGSFGIIRKVRDKKTGRIMCRKEINYNRMSQKEREQLQAEFKILSTVRHENIVAYYSREHLKTTQDLHLYMEYCGNGDLGKVIKDLQKKNEYAEETFVWAIFAQLVSALYRCHYGVSPPEVGKSPLGLKSAANPKPPAGGHMVLHRDLKPENVFLGEGNSVKLGDFGLSKMMASHDFATTYVGTPFYMSPEICAAERYTLKSDIWSLGCIIYELCTKEPPFNAKTHLQLIQKIRDGKFAPLPKQYSPELCEVVRSCLQVNPNRRPDTAMLLNIPYVVLMRKEREIFNKCKEADEMEEAATKKLLEADAKLKRLEQTEQNIRQEIDSQLHREWEVKAALEIKRLVEEETNKLRDTFEKEVQARVQAELAKLSGQSSTSTAVPVDFASSVPTDIGLSSVSSSGEADFSSATDLTSLSLEDSPEQPKALKRTARTPFGRAQTMFAQRAGTPADIEMADPSPMSIASLSLSPRRKGAIKAPTGRNIFADADKPSSERLQAILMNSDSDDDDDVPIPSPTRPMSSKNPFQSANRPKLSTTKTAPLPRPLSRGGSDQSNRGISAPTVSTLSNQLPTLRSKASSGALKERPISPNRRLSRIPSSNNLHVSEPMSSPTRKPSVTRKAVSASDDLNKLATKNMAMKANGAPPRGRSLVELAQARAGGRPLSMYEENSPKAKKTYSDRMGVGQAATYDPATEEMPSPFLIKSRHIPGF